MAGEPSERPVRVALLEDNPLMRESLALLLRHAGLEVVLSCGEASAFFAGLAEAAPEVALVDLVLRDTDPVTGTHGLATLERLGREHPHVRCLVLSGSREPGIARACARAGAQGFLPKLTTPTPAVLEALQRVARGERVFPGGGGEGPPTPPRGGPPPAG